MMVTLFFLSAILLLVIGMPIATAVGLSSLLYILLSDIPVMIVIQKLFSSIDSAPLLAIPFFTLAGGLMLTGGLAGRLIKLANSLVGNVSGGLGIVTILGCMFFAAISGSSIATAAALGSIMIPAMVNKGYDREFAGAIVGAASPLGVIIPPSITFIIYASITNTSIKDLYTLGIPAGIIIGLALMIVAYVVSKKNGYKGADHPFSLKEFLIALKDASWALGTPIIMVGGVFGGILTPTESAVVAVVYAIFVGKFIYKEMTVKHLWPIFRDSAKSTASVMFIICNAALFAYVLTIEQIPQSVTKGLLALSDNAIVLLLIINVILLIAGTFMETIAILVIMVPMFMPVVQHIGMDPVFFGLIVIINTAIGMCTPPFGLCLLTAGNIGKANTEKLMRRSVVPICAMIIVMFVLTYFPDLVMWTIEK